MATSPKINNDNKNKSMEEKGCYVNPVFVGGVVDEEAFPRGKDISSDSYSVNDSIPSDDKSAGTRCTTCLWRTIEMVETQSKDEEISLNIRNLIVYIFFVVITCIIAYGRVDVNNYYFPKVVEGRFLDESWNKDMPGYTFRDAGTHQDFWNWLFGPFLDGLYWESWYNDDEVTKYKNYIMSSVKLLGLARLRQIRVRRPKDSSSCHMVKLFNSNVSCTPKFAATLEDSGDDATDEDWNKSADQYPDLTAWTYKGESELPYGRSVGQWAGAFQSVMYSIAYPEGGFIQNLPPTSDEAKSVLQALKNATWVDEATAAVVIDFTVYNPNVNLFCQVQLMAEFPEFGGMTPSWSFTTVNLFRIETANDYFLLACEIFFILFTIYYIVEEIIEISIHRLSYFKKFFNIVDVVIIAIAIAWIVFFGISTYKIYYAEEVTKLIRNVTDNAVPTDFVSLDGIVTRLYYLQTLSAVILFFAWIKFFKFLSFSPTMNQLGETISRSVKDIMFFLIMFFLVFFAFAQFAFLLFGTKLDDFSDFGNCIFTQLRIILGDFDYPALEKASYFWGPIYFFLYIFFVFFVLINMFLAIIADTYSSVKEDTVEEDSWVLQKAARLFSHAKTLLHLGERKKEIKDLLDFVNQHGGVNKDDASAIDDWRPKLKAEGYTEAQIQAFFSEFDLNNDERIDEQEFSVGLERLKQEGEELDQLERSTNASLVFEASCGQFTTEAQMNTALERIIAIENQVTTLAEKMDEIVEQLKCEAVKRQSIETRMGLALFSSSSNSGANQ